MGEEPAEQIAVTCLPLSEVIERYCSVQKIDLVVHRLRRSRFGEALDSVDWNKTRPTVIITEEFGQFGLNKPLAKASPIRAYLSE